MISSDIEFLVELLSTSVITTSNKIIIFQYALFWSSLTGNSLITTEKCMLWIMKCITTNCTALFLMITKYFLIKKILTCHSCSQNFQCSVLLWKFQFNCYIEISKIVSIKKSWLIYEKQLSNLYVFLFHCAVILKVKVTLTVHYYFCYTSFYLKPLFVSNIRHNRLLSIIFVLRRIGLDNSSTLMY